MTKVDGSTSTGSVRFRRTSASAVVGWVLIASGCNDSRVSLDSDQDTTQAPAPDSGVDTSDTTVDAGTVSDTSSSAATSDVQTLDAGEPPAADAGGATDADSGVTPETLQLDFFGTYDNTYKFVVSEQQLSQMNQRYNGGGPVFVKANLAGDIYTPGGEGDSDKTYVDHLFATNTLGETADFGKTEVRLVGESTGRAWTARTLPNFRVDTNEFTKGHKFGGYENVRFNNAIIGNIFREKYTLDLYRELGYPAPRATYAWVETSVWGDDVKVPYVAVEVYKRSFCKDRAEYFGGECVNMWEFPGDFGEFSQFSEPAACQFGECDATRVNELNDLISSLTPGPGFKAAIADYLDWDSYHEFQCLSWILATGDDALHNMNNFVLAERTDGKFQYLPYSVDISFGQEWYPVVELPARNTISRGCQADTECWADTVTTCERLLDSFAATDPVGRLDNLYQELGDAGMLRTGDEDRYQFIRGYVSQRLTDMPTELDAVREDPYVNGCPNDQIWCGSYCAYQWECQLCNDEGGGGGDMGEPIPVDILPAGDVAPPGDSQGIGIGQPPPVGDGGVDETSAPYGDGGVEPNPCLPVQKLYSVN